MRISLHYKFAFFFVTKVVNNIFSSNDNYKILFNSYYKFLSYFLCRKNVYNIPVDTKIVTD